MQKAHHGSVVCRSVIGRHHCILFISDEEAQTSAVNVNYGQSLLIL